MRTFSFAKRSRQTGAATVEFALVASFGGLFVVLIAALELGRVMFYLNTANEAARLGARIAAVCNANDATIKSRMQTLLPMLKVDDIDVSYLPDGCAASAEEARKSCESVMVAIRPNLKIDTVIPMLPLSVELPAFSTTLSREAMDSSGC